MCTSMWREDVPPLSLSFPSIDFEWLLINGNKIRWNDNDRFVSSPSNVSKMTSLNKLGCRTFSVKWRRRDFRVQISIWKNKQNFSTLIAINRCCEIRRITRTTSQAFEIPFSNKPFFLFYFFSQKRKQIYFKLNWREEEIIPGTWANERHKSRKAWSTFFCLFSMTMTCIFVLGSDHANENLCWCQPMNRTLLLCGHLLCHVNDSLDMIC